MRTTKGRRPALATSVAALVLVAGCAESRPRGPITAPEPAPEGSSPATAAAESSTSPAQTTSTSALPAVPSSALLNPATSGPGCPVRRPRAEPSPTRPTYKVDISIDSEVRQVTGSSTTRFTPDLATDRIVLRLWPNAPVARAGGGSMTLGTVTVDGVSVGVEQGSDPTLAEIRRPVAANATVTVASSWRITLAAGLAERWSVAGGAVRLGSYVPLLPWEPGVGWATDPATLVHGEATTSPAADWDVAVDARGLDVVATGTRASDGRWKASAVRDVGLTAGRFRRAEALARAGVSGAPVAVIVVAQEGMADDPALYAARSVKALESFAKRFGPYPYPDLTIALSPTLKGGIEHPRFIMQGPGTLGRTTSHEIAHQWFYSLVGNDQGRDPWLDEGLASWAEAGFEGTLDSMRATVIPPQGRGHAGEPTRFFDDKRPAYYRSVYVQPVQALAGLGDPGLVDCVLAAWADAMAHRIATASGLRSALTATFSKAPSVMAPYGL